MDDIFNDLVEADVFFYDAVDFPEQRVTGIGLENLFIAFAAGFEQSGVLQTIEFQSDRIARFTEFTFQTAQISCCMAVQKELQQQLYAGFR